MKLLLATAQENAAESMAQRDAIESQRQNLNEELQELGAARDALKTDIANLTQRAEQTEAALTQRAERAETAVSRVESETAKLRASLAAIGKSKVVIPVPTLENIRKQFDALATDFRKKGDIASEVMCEIGRSAINQAIDDNMTRPNAAA